MPALAEHIYTALYEDDDGRVCRDISDRACQVVPGNFFRLALALAMSKLADALMSPKTTLPWVLTSIGAPAWIAASLVPVRESGSMLPQLAIGPWVRGLAKRKWAWVGGAIAQAVAIAMICGVALSSSGMTAGLLILFAVVLFSLARGFCSVSAKDVLGKTVPKQRRGQATGLGASVAGLGTLGFAATLMLNSDDTTSELRLLMVAALLFLIAAWLFSRIEEQPGANEGGESGLVAAVRSLRLLRDDKTFGRFVLVRASLVGSALLAPFLLLATDDADLSTLGFFLAAQGAASFLSGPLWGRFADVSSRRVLILAAIGVAALGFGIVALDLVSPAALHHPATLPAAFFALALLHDGVRAGRKTYLIDLGSADGGGPDKRTDYVAVSNTVIGIVLLIAAAVSSGLSVLDTTWAIAILAASAVVSAALAFSLPEVQALADD